MSRSVEHTDRAESGRAPDQLAPEHVLGCTPEEAADLLRGRRVTPGEVETLAMSTYEWWRHLRDPGSYWVTTSQAARLLHLSPGAVRTMLDDHRLPYVVHSSGVRLMRRHEIAARVGPGGRAGPDGVAGPDGRAGSPGGAMTTDDAGPADHAVPVARSEPLGHDDPG